jgi:hypothetical protein
MPRSNPSPLRRGCAAALGSAATAPHPAIAPRHEVRGERRGEEGAVRVGAAEARAGEREEALPAQAMVASGWWEAAARRGEWEETRGGGGRRRRGGGNGRWQARWWELNS